VIRRRFGDLRLLTTIDSINCKGTPIGKHEREHVIGGCRSKKRERREPASSIITT
jgi:hypothetical protein